MKTLKVVTVWHLIKVGYSLTQIDVAVRLKDLIYVGNGRYAKP